MRLARTEGNDVEAALILPNETGLPLSEEVALLYHNMKKIGLVDELFVIDKGGVIGEFPMKYITLAEHLNKKVRRLSEFCPEWWQIEKKECLFKHGISRIPGVAADAA